MSYHARLRQAILSCIQSSSTHDTRQAKDIIIVTISWPTRQSFLTFQNIILTPFLLRVWTVSHLRRYAHLYHAVTAERLAFMNRHTALVRLSRDALALPHGVLDDAFVSNTWLPTATYNFITVVEYNSYEFFTATSVFSCRRKISLVIFTHGSFAFMSSLGAFAVMLVAQTAGVWWRHDSWGL